MKKKIEKLFCLALLLFAFSGIKIFAQDAANPLMVTDAEILQVLNQYNFDKAQQEYLLKEVRKQLDNFQANGTFDESLIDNQTTSAKNEKEKKYSKHDFG